MNVKINWNGNKGFRLLNIYERLNKGEVIEKAQLADSFSVTQKTIQRDIDELRTYLSETHISDKEIAIKYDKSRNAYYLFRIEREWLTNEEVISLCKILLESRAFCKKELNSLINKLLAQVVPSDRIKIESIIRNEQHHYVPLRHGKLLLGIIWDLSQSLINNEIIRFSYSRQDGIVKKKTVKPVSIMFSEFYFYLIAYHADGSKDYPTTFRIERINDLQGTKQHFTIPYKDRFNEGEFHKRVQFMYSGELRKVIFEYNGPSLEAVLDRLPTAEVLYEKDGTSTIRVEIYGSGIDMWLRSQGNYIKSIKEVII